MAHLLQIGLSNAIVSGVLALLAVGASRLCRRPALAHALWVLVLLKLITPPVHIIPIEWPAHAEEALTDISSVAMVTVQDEPEGPTVDEAPAVAGEEAFIEPIDMAALADGPAEEAAAQQDAPVNDRSASPATAAVNTPFALTEISWAGVILTCWLAGSICWLALAALRAWRFRCLLRYARPATVQLQAQAGELAGRLGLASCPGVWMVPGRVSPMLYALGGKPRLLLPAELWQGLPEEQHATLLAHELAHLLRLDHWVRGLEILATCLYWWHPVVWWARRELREAEEQCCDAWVVWALPRSAKAYALALVETLDFLSVARPVLPVAASGVGHIHDLRRRLTMIMRGTTPRRLTWAGFVAVVGVAALLLPVLPTWAQGPGPRDGDTRDPRPAGDLPRAQRGGDDQARAGVERARAELRVAQAELEKARAQVAQAEAKLKAAQARLAQAQGQRPGGGTRMIIIITDGQGREIRRIEVPTDGRPGGGGAGAGAGRPQNDLPPGGGGGFGGGGGIGRGGRGFGGGQGGGFFGMQGGGGVIRGPAGADSDRRIKDLENKLDIILKELENLRKQIRPGERRPDGSRQPGGGRRPEGDKRPEKPGAGAGDQKREVEIELKGLDLDPEVKKQLEKVLRDLNKRKSDGKKPDVEIRKEIIIEREKAPEKDKAPLR